MNVYLFTCDNSCSRFLISFQQTDFVQNLGKCSLSISVSIKNVKGEIPCRQKKRRIYIFISNPIYVLD